MAHIDIPIFPHRALSNLISFVGKRDPAILLGDFNAHHLIWSATRVNADPGQILEEEYN